MAHRAFVLVMVFIVAAVVILVPRTQYIGDGTQMDGMSNSAFCDFCFFDNDWNTVESDAVCLLPIHGHSIQVDIEHIGEVFAGASVADSRIIFRVGRKGIAFDFVGCIVSRR